MPTVKTMDSKGMKLYRINGCPQEPGHHAAFVPCSACQLSGFSKENGQFENCKGVAVQDPEKR